ncbi:MAG: asparagine synthase (glutamine-hydrolyzing) [Proteobacteria bacterium]|nr:asparagine synthase (glutamine-hydrolyzing) [Pseudomonadota bacterium]
MCGIAGVWSPEPLAEGTDARLRAMADVLVHRGPDGEGVWTDGQVGFGHRRLAIIDLSPAAAQPMSDAEGVIHVVHNGEVYNFPQLREELMALGYQFKSRSDTEVIVNGYKQWGEAVVGRLRGMFAFAIWDSRNRRLLLARDRAGQKPLYYTWRDGTLIFGSEIKAILAWPGVPREPDLTAIHHYLTFMYVPAPFTAFAGIRRLAAAHTMVVEADGASRIERYWSLPAPEAARPRPRAELAEEITARLDEAVRLRMISDVPLGAFLSGGVDSASVVASMARVSDRPVKTFTIGFAHDQYDERRYARMVAERFATDHNEFVVEADAVAVLPQIVWHYGEPFADSSAIPTWYVSEITRRHVTVALNGDGGDESFLGYPRYTGCRVGAWADALPGPARTLMAALGRALPFETSQRRLLRYARRFLVDADAPPAERYVRWITLFTDAQKGALYGDAMRDCLAERSADVAMVWLGGGTFDVARAAYADIHTYLPDDLLVKVDVATMAHGLEGRSPFLDHELMGFAATIPARAKMPGTETKALLKSVMTERLPRELLYREKMGFSAPIEHWLRDELKEMAFDTLLSPRARARGLFDADGVRRLLDEHVAGARPHHHRIWALLMLELWFAMWIDPARPPARP